MKSITSTSLRSLIAAWEGDGCMKDTDHRMRHPRVHLSDRASARRARGCAEPNGQYGRGMAPSWAGATPLFATCSWRKNRGVAPAHTFSEKRVSGRGGIGMLLAIQRSYKLLAKYGCFARQICDKCGIVLAAVRFTRYGESEVYCSRECRGDAHRAVTLSPGRPRKYKTESERRAQKRDSSGHIGWHPNVEKTVRIPSETKSLQRQELPLSYLGTPGPAEPLSSSWRTANGDRAKTRVADASATEHETLRKHFSNPRMQKRRMDYVGSQGPTKTTKECHSANSR